MKPQCIEAVQNVVGRKLNQVEIQGIEERIARNMRQLARESPDDWRAMSPADRLAAAGKSAAEEFTAEQAKKSQRVALQVLATSRAFERMGQVREAGKPAASAVVKVLEEADVYAKGVQHENFSALMDAMHAAEPRFFGWLENPVAVRDFVREVFGEATGNEVATKGAKAWQSTIEQMRQRFNRSGGDVRKLDYGYLPQPHDAAKVREAGADAWVSEIAPLLDRSRYLKVDGAAMNDAELAAFLRSAHETIATDGLNKLEPGQFAGSGMRANRGNEGRQIHFKDADSYLAYMNQYGRGRVFDAMQGHVGRLARDIGLVEQFGPNPEHLFRQLNDTAIKADGGEKFVGPLLIRAKDAWSALSGYSAQTVHQRLGDWAQGLRNYQVAAKLQGAMLSSFSDVPTLFLTAHINRLPLWETFTNTIRAFGSKSTDYANRAGLVADSVVSDMNRWAEGNIGQGWSARLANMTMRLSLLQAWTDALRRGFSVTMMGSLGKLSRVDWAALEASDRGRLEAKGISAADWQVWQLAQPENWRGSAMLTPEAIRAIPDESLAGIGRPATLRDQATAKLLGFISDESEYAVVAPDLMTRAAVTRSTQKGTIEGEFLRSLALFKSFPLAMISRHMRRAAEMDSGMGTAGYAASLMLGVTMFGALSLQSKDMKDGKDPRDMTDPKFWAAAFVQGGGAGIYGDLLYTGMGGQNRGGVPNWAGTLGGPIFGAGFDLANLTAGNVGDMLKGRRTNAGAELLRFSRQNLPFVNLWYGKAALDHMFFHEMQEHLSPGYLGRMRDMARDDWDQRFWWEPGAGVDRMRAPDMAAAVGGR